jgi:hypothetical protein
MAINNTVMNKTTYRNRYGDIITFEHIDNKVLMTGGTWLRYGRPNVYDIAYQKYVESAKVDAKLAESQILTEEQFIELLHFRKDEDSYESPNLWTLFGRYVYSDTESIDMVDPSGGPYISIEDNLNEFWPKGKYQDLLIEKIEVGFLGEEEMESLVTFTLK